MDKELLYEYFNQTTDAFHQNACKRCGDDNFSTAGTNVLISIYMSLRSRVDELFFYVFEAFKFYSFLNFLHE